MSNIKAQLTSELAATDWNDLKPHAQRDAIIIVDQSLNLVDVGVAIANDNTMLVQEWITGKLIYKPSVEELSFLNNNPQQQFNALIVQPFVLISQI
jgi:hypothetical protein